MLKKLFIFLFLILITVYLVIAVTILNAKPNGQTCDGMELVIKDSIDYGFISKREVLRLLNGKKLSPIGKILGEITVYMVLYFFWSLLQRLSDLLKFLLPKVLKL